MTWQITISPKEIATELRSIKATIIEDGAHPDGNGVTDLDRLIALLDALGNLR